MADGFPSGQLLLIREQNKRHVVWSITEITPWMLRGRACGERQLQPFVSPFLLEKDKMASPRSLLVSDLVRCRKGTGKEAFFKKRIPPVFNSSFLHYSVALQIKTAFGLLTVKERSSFFITYGTPQATQGAYITVRSLVIKHLGSHCDVRICATLPLPFIGGRKALPSSPAHLTFSLEVSFPVSEAGYSFGNSERTYRLVTDKTKTRR